MKLTKRVLAIFLAVVVLISALPMAAAVYGEAYEIHVGETLVVNLPENGSASVKFTAEKDLTLVLTSNADSSQIDPYCSLYDSERSVELAYDDDGGSDLNFALTYAFEAGKTYYFEVTELGGDPASFAITLACAIHTPEGEAFCLGQKCQVCGLYCGETDDENHVDETIYVENAKDATKHNQEYACCGKTAGEAEAHTFADGACVKCQEPYKIIHQPTLAEPWVELNEGTGASYQWYSMEVKEMEVTPDNAEVFDGSLVNTSDSYYEDGTGWMPATYVMENGMYVSYYFVVDVAAGDTIYVSAPADVLIEDAALVDYESSDSIDYDVEISADNVVTMTANETETVVFAMVVDRSDVAVTAYMGGFTGEKTPVDGENTATLTNPVLDLYYMCAVTCADGTELNSNVLKWERSIIHQPTAKEPYVETNVPEGASYQWYQVNKFTNTYTVVDGEEAAEDEILRDRLWEGEYSNGVWNSSEDSTIDLSFDVEAGDVIQVTVSDDFSGNVSQYSGSSFTESNGIYTYTVLGNDSFNIYITDDEAFTATIQVIRNVYEIGEAVEGQTDAELTVEVDGMFYACKLTWEDGAELTSDIMQRTYAITHQPTADAPYVETNADAKVQSYQWYSIAAKEVTDKEAKAFTLEDQTASYDSTIGWTGVTDSDPENPDYIAYAYCTMQLSAGDVITVIVDGTVYENIFWISDTGYIEWPVTGEENGVYVFEIEENGEYRLYADATTDDMTVRIYSGYDYEAVAEQTQDTLTAYIEGFKYACQVTFEDGTVLMSDAFDGIDVHLEHIGGTATCVDYAVCEGCGRTYGELDSDNHAGETEVRDAVAATEDTDGYTGDTYCLDCGKKIATGEPIPATGTSDDNGSDDEGTDEGSGDNDTEQGGSGNEDSDTTIPKTGDTDNIAVWFLVLAIGAGVAMVVLNRKKSVKAN